MNITQVKKFIAGTVNEEDIFDILQVCAMKLGWNIGIEEGQEIVRGITIGTPEYMDAYFKKDADR